MAEQDTTGDSATAESAGETTETTATGAASATQADPYEARFAAIQKQAEQAQRAADGAARLVHQRDAELNRLRQENARYRQGSENYGTEGETTEARPQADPELRTRLQLLEFKQTHPDWRDRLTEMQEVASDSVFAERFGNDLGSRATFEAAYEVAENRKLRAENATLRAVKEKSDQAKQIRKDQAFVSGQGASVAPEAIDREALMKMTPEEMVKKFGRDALMRGIY